MLQSRLAVAVTALCGMLVACHPSAPTPALASCIPPGTTLLGGVHLEKLRASGFDRRLPPAARGLFEAHSSASEFIFASNGASFAIITRGGFREAPAGYTLIAPGLAVWGAPEAVARVTEQHRTGKAGAPEMLAYAEPLVGNPIWAVARGSATLPLSGNLANLNRFLQATDYTTLVAEAGEELSIEIKGMCRTADAAAQLERTIRAFVSLLGMRSRSSAPVQIETQDATVRVKLTADPADVERLMRAGAPPAGAPK